MRPSPARLAATLFLLALAPLVAGCGSINSPFSKPKDVTYAQVQSVSVGLTVAQVTDALGPPQSESRGASGRVDRMRYRALDAKGNAAALDLDFDARGTLVRKEFSGVVTRP